MPKLREETIIPAYEHTAYSWAMHEAMQYVANLLFSVCHINFTCMPATDFQHQLNT